MLGITSLVYDYGFKLYHLPPVKNLLYILPMYLTFFTTYHVYILLKIVESWALPGHIVFGSLKFVLQMALMIHVASAWPIRA